LLAEHPGRYTPIAGGTELMVAMNTGRLAVRELLSLHRLHELRVIDAQPDAITLGAGTTFTGIRRHAAIVRDLPLLAEAASWTGSIANQNRGTLGGNIVNASPAADSPPALLAYDATVRLVSAMGERTLLYSDFHVGYKKTAMRADELLYSITVPLKWSNYASRITKVGARKAQAISKVALAALANVQNGRLTDVRLGAASLGDRPLRLLATEAALRGREVHDETLRNARAVLAGEIQPIDDIRSTAKYRAAVAGNLLEEFLRSVV
jgi:CO/xanthine dehydrogenase FAD-binding subunit